MGDKGDRRRPVATLVLIGLSLGAFVGFGRGVNPAGERIRAAEDAVWRHWAANPWLELDERFVSAAVSPVWRRTVGSELEARRAANPTAATIEKGAGRDALEDLTAAYFTTLEVHPYRRWGLVPARPRPIGAAVGLLLFPGWPAMLIGVAFLLLAGAALERAAGSLVVGGLYVAGALVGLLVPALLFPSSWWPVVGAAAGVAAVLGGAAARFAGGELSLVAVRRDRALLTIPAALLLPCWLGLTMLAVVLTPPADGRRSLALALAVALGAVAGGVNRWRRHAPAPATVPAIPDLVEGLDLLAAGETARARDALQRVLADDPGQADANLAMWQSYLQDGMPGQGAEHMVRVIEADLRRRDPERAWEHWQELLTRGGTAGPSALRWRIAGELRAVDPVRARDVLTQLADDVTAGMASEKARHRLAAEPPAIAAAGTAEVLSPLPGGVTPTVAPAPERGEADLEDVSLPKLKIPAAAAGRPPVPEVCLLEQLQTDGLVLRGEDGQARLLAYRNLEAIAVGGIAETSKPYVVLDLLPVAEPGRARRGCRLVSTQFDPRRFVGQAGLTPVEAFRELVRVIAGASGARLLPGPEVLQRIPVFASPAAYEREVLGLAPRG
jgi:membrane associated rhomboid family serine protease